MVDRSLKPILQKLLAFWLAFIALHFAYDFFPSPFLAVFSGTSEAVAQHQNVLLCLYICEPGGISPSSSST